jgi:AraC-like DNA-binding protein
MVEIFDNIRKIYQFKAPREELSDKIEFFSESCAAATQAHISGQPFTVKMFSSWTPTVWINLGPSYKLVIDKKSFVVPAGKSILVLRDTIVERINQPADHIFTIKFHPGGLESLLGIQQSMFSGKWVDVHEILSKQLVYMLVAAHCIEERIELIETWLLDQIRSKKRGDNYFELVKNSIATYESGRLKYNVDELAAQVFLSSKTINRYFKRVIGTTPKQYLSNLRAREALTSFVADRKAFDPSLFGYYDNSHFYKEMVKFTGSGFKDGI